MTFPERVRTQYPGQQNFFSLNTYGVNGSSYFPQSSVTYVGYPFGKITMDTLNNHYTPGVLAVRPFDIRSYRADFQNANLKSYFKRPAGFPETWPNYNSLTGALGLSGLSPGAWQSPQTEVRNIEQAAWSLAFSKVGRPSASSMQNIAEAKMLARQLQSPLRGVQDVFKRLSQGYRGPRRTWPQTLRGAASVASERWLAYQMGWKPLFQDVCGTIDTLERALNKSRHGFEVAPGSCQTSYGDTYPPYTYLQNYWYVTRQLWNKTQVRHSIKLYYSLWDDPGRYEMTKLGLNPRFWAGGAFDLIPYSFVVNWASDIQGYLYARSAVGMPGYLGACSSIKTTSVNGARFVNVRDLSGAGSPGFEGSYTSDRYYRTSAVVPSSFNVNSLLALRNPLAEISRGFTAAALGYQRSCRNS